jgi:hypothetical protein
MGAVLALMTGNPFPPDPRINEAEQIAEAAWHVRGEGSPSGGVA